MILKSINMENFKSIEASTKFSIDPVTCLVGKNEAGKSALLQALYKLNPDVKEESKFSEIEEYPRRHLSDYQETQKTAGATPANVLTTVWQLDDADRKVIEEAYGPNSLSSATVTITKGYANVQYWTIPVDEKQIVKHFLASAGLYQEELYAIKGTTIGDLVEELEGLEAPSERQSEFLSKLKNTFPEGSPSKLAISLLDGRLPTFLYFADYQKMPGQISMTELLKRKQENQLKFTDRVFLALLDLTGTTPEEIQTIGKFEQFIAKLEAVSNRLTQEIFTYWRQNRQLEVDFRFDQARPEDPPPFNAGFVFRTRIRNKRHGVTVSFDERSSGFVWFFSFLVWFSQVRKNYGENLFILLDEPGLSLHGRAQQDLLRYINEKLRPKYQVIFTTHSPFMVDPENLLSVRTVEDVTFDGKILGTKVGDKVLSTDADTVFPLQAALGYDITQSLFVGKHTLLVEGPSDLLYLSWFRRELQAARRGYLDKRWTIAPAGGIDKIGSFVTLFGGNKLHVAVLTDLHEGVKRKIRDLKESKLLRDGHVFTVETYANKNEADVEDLLGRSLYIYLVNNCYSLKGNQQIQKDKSTTASDRVIKEVGDHFRTLPSEVPEFDHFAPASYLIENSAELRTTLPDLDQAMDRFEQLFKDLNKLLEIPKAVGQSN